MSRHARRLPSLLAALLAGAVLALVVPGIAPGSAPPSTASFTAVDLAWQVTGDPGSGNVTIAQGGTVAFGYPSGRTRHNADFSGGPAPASCTQIAGAPGDTPPPLPTTPTAPGWSGSCTFDAPGTYTFHCDLHAFMHGTVVVVDPNAPPPPTAGGGSTGTGGGSSGTTTTSPPPTTGAGTTPGSASPGGTTPAGATPPAAGATPSPSGTPARLQVRVARLQHGAVVRGAVSGAAAGSRIAVTALVSNALLTTRRPHGHAHAVRVGARRLRATAAGSTPFALTLGAAARGALRRRQSLTVTLRVVVTRPGARAVVRTARVVVRERRPAQPPAPAPAPGYAY